MDTVRYGRLRDEAIGIKRRSRRDQVRLMLILKEVHDEGVLGEFCEDINLSIAAANNYLAAHDLFITEHGIIPGTGEGTDDLIASLWENVFDPTLFDTRYDNVDREGIDAEVERLGLRGPTKAYDIAKNVRSLFAAITGDGRAARAASEALAWKMEHDEEFREAAHAMGLYFVAPDNRPRPNFPRGKKDPWFSDITHAVAVIARLREKAFNDPAAPPALMEYCSKIRDDAAAVVDLIRGRIEMDQMEAADGSRQ